MFVSPDHPQNETFNESVPPLAPDNNLLKLYYDCTDFSSEIFCSSYVGEIGCGEDRRSYYVIRNLSSPLLDGVRDLLNDFKRFFRRNISIPASRPVLTVE
ncbi:LEAF RUST 10 DISEASE-RESISTANCE LOCUS RECEPTOR-LIKE PROTEIN KINASE-like 2.8 [Cardamine amara subsp. amara]|uniref:LEAF RUST 10 DISEASE-RESISTANCE LOCUS RECEPTOR-LIKE PROTEIN KINASE-like 2.8 n=1 Tax=Cardamine amara subsp. amara TaxID=228776 RepID=A0ABD0ZY33_CARAN